MVVSRLENVSAQMQAESSDDESGAYGDDSSGGYEDDSDEREDEDEDEDESSEENARPAGVHCCEICTEAIVGNRYQGTEDKDYNLCDRCFPDMYWGDEESAFVEHPSGKTIHIHEEVCEGERCQSSDVAKRFVGKRYEAHTYRRAYEYNLCEHCFENYSGEELTFEEHPGGKMIFRHTCNSCRKSPFFGKRYQVVDNEHFNLCQNCFDNYDGKELSFEEHPGGKVIYRHTCGSCDKPTPGKRYQGVNNEDFNLCESCFFDKNYIGEEIAFTEYPENNIISRYTCCSCNSVASKRYDAMINNDNTLCDTCFKKNSSGEETTYRTEHSCNSCDMAPIVGKWYQAMENENCQLCAKCFNNWYTYYGAERGFVENPSGKTFYRYGCDFCANPLIEGKRYQGMENRSYFLCEHCFTSYNYGNEASFEEHPSGKIVPAPTDPPKEDGAKRMVPFHMELERLRHLRPRPKPKNIKNATKSKFSSLPPDQQEMLSALPPDQQEQIAEQMAALMMLGVNTPAPPTEEQGDDQGPVDREKALKVGSLVWYRKLGDFGMWVWKIPGSITGHVLNNEDQVTGYIIEADSSGYNPKEGFEEAMMTADREVFEALKNASPQKTTLRWDGKMPPCPIPGLENTESAASGGAGRWEEAKERFGEDLGFEGAKQNGLGAEMWGITRDQILALRSHTKYRLGMTMYELVDEIIKPETLGTGMGYALLKNRDKPQRARTMISHAWGETFVEFCYGLGNDSGGDFEKEPLKGPFWVCAFANYQNADIPELTIAKQLGPSPKTGPFATVLKQADEMVAVVTNQCDIYTRLWCVYEIFVAMKLNLPVSLRSTDMASADMSYSNVVLDSAATPVASSTAECGWEPDKIMIRKEINEEGGFDIIDDTVMWVRIATLVKDLEQYREKHVFYNESAPIGSTNPQEGEVQINSGIAVAIDAWEKARASRQ